MRTAGILIIDDEELIRETLADFLTDSGYEVSGASTGEEGIDLLSKGVYDLVIVDRFLPDMNCEEFISRTHSPFPQLRFLIHTGDVSYTITPRLFDLGLTPESLLRKPVRDYEKMLDLIHSILNMNAVSGQKIED